MYFRILGIAIPALLISTPSTGVAQFVFPNTSTSTSATSPPATSVTFTMQVNLTQLSPDLEKVRLICAIMPSDVFKPPTNYLSSQAAMEAMPKDEIPAVAGQVVGTLRVIFPIAAEWLINPGGKDAQYTCQLFGLSRAEQKWGVFSETSTIPALMLKPAPQQITGTFPW